ncbi:MAG: family 16 glycosylhydrolase [Bacteroidales bacterium]
MFNLKNVAFLSRLLLFITVFFQSCEWNKKTNSPKLLISDTEIHVAEDIPAGLLEIPFYMSVVPEASGSFDYYIVDSTAIAGIDYVESPKTTVSFSAGEVNKVIQLQILHNTQRISDVVFKVKLENPKNCILPAGELKIRIMNVDYGTLVWSDEFSYSPLNDNIWNYETGGGGWGNNELQVYTNSVTNIHIDSGYLHITVLNPAAGSYSSGRITTKGKREFKNCRVEIRAKLPEGKGLWPALWMLGANFSSVGWPSCGEIDIMEFLGHDPATSYGALHWNRNGHTYFTGTYSLQSGKFSTEFHIFSLEWTPNNIRWYVDDNLFFTKTKSEIQGFPLELPQFFIFNVAVGGNWPGNPDQTTIFPQHMIIDYLRVYQ